MEGIRLDDHLLTPAHVVGEIVFSLDADPATADDLSDPVWTHERFPQFVHGPSPAPHTAGGPDFLRAASLVNGSLLRILLIGSEPIGKDPAEGRQVRKFFRMFCVIVRGIRTLQRIGSQICRKLLVKPLHHVFEIAFDGLRASVIRICARQPDAERREYAVILPGKRHRRAVTGRHIIFAVVEIRLDGRVSSGRAAILRHQLDLIVCGHAVKRDHPRHHKPGTCIHQPGQHRPLCRPSSVRCPDSHPCVEGPAVADHQISGIDHRPVALRVVAAAVAPGYFAFAFVDDDFLRQVLDIIPHSRKFRNCRGRHDPLQRVPGIPV